jgi:hypothetical protein
MRVAQTCLYVQCIHPHLMAMSFLPASFNANTLIGLTAALLIGFAAVRKWAAGGQCTSRRKLDGKTALITGANSGIGFQTALDLARRRARVIIACRSAPLMEAAVAELRARSSNPNVHGMLLDLGDLAQVREFAARFAAAEARLDILVLNAGVMAVPVHTKTKDGCENLCVLLCICTRFVFMKCHWQVKSSPDLLVTVRAACLSFWRQF